MFIDTKFSWQITVVQKRVTLFSQFRYLQRTPHVFNANMAFCFPKSNYRDSHRNSQKFKMQLILKRSIVTIWDLKQDERPNNTYRSEIPSDLLRYHFCIFNRVGIGLISVIEVELMTDWFHGLSSVNAIPVIEVEQDEFHGLPSVEQNFVLK